VKKPSVDLHTEAEANYFAICLLMPEEMVHAEIAKLTEAERDIDRIFPILSAKFQVSQQLVALRFVELGYGF
jgi:Zn-dependent peptidase ImmA (M78 family)